VTGPAIREMTAEDISPVMEIERSSFLTPWTEGMFRSQLRFRDQAINLVLVADGAVAGYAAAWIACDELHLLSIAVDPARRRSGLGSAMLRAVMERGKIRGAVCVMLEVREGNAAARAFYRMHGFVDVGVRRRYYSDTDEDAIIMQHRFGA
jgi:[ribosomal protein S18]-alanine N-acetyltransferase